MIHACVTGVVCDEPKMSHVEGDPRLKVMVTSIKRSRRGNDVPTPVTLTLWGWRATKYAPAMTRGRMVAATGELTVYRGELDLKTNEIDFLSSHEQEE